MGLFRKNRDTQSDAPAAADAPNGARVSDGEKAVFYLLAVRTLISLIGRFSLDIRELDPDAFKSSLDELTGRFDDEKKMSVLEQQFWKQKHAIQTYADAQKSHLLDREGELRGIIEFLTRTLYELNDDNRSFAATLSQQGDRMEAISRLDDIKQLRQSLQQEVEQFRRTLSQKQAKDQQKVKTLAGRVNHLNAELAKAKTESLTDGLTGAFNRKAFDETLERMVDESKGRRDAFALMLLDIDNFKAINDTYGHPLGDRVLMALVLKCKEHIRSEDFLARYGGEEFAILLPGASLRNTGKKAKKLCRAVAEARYMIDDGGKGEPIGFTVSIGVSAFDAGDTAMDVVNRADKALYTAKGTGKNKAVVEKR